ISEFLSITQNRLNGYIDALKKHDIPVREERIVHCSFDVEEMHGKIRALFSLEHRPTAVLASVERLAIACVEVFQEMNLRIPEDVALIGFSDNPLNRLMAPSMSCIRQPTFDIGQKSAELLLDLIENKNKEKRFKPIRLQTTLDIHASSRRPAAGLKK